MTSETATRPDTVKYHERRWKAGLPLISHRSLGIVIEYAEFLSEVCRSAIQAGRTVPEWFSDKLSTEERELLIASAQTGLFNLHHVENVGISVLANGKQFPPDGNALEPTDPMCAAIYLEAFIRLCANGLVLPERRSQDDEFADTFRLTGAGFRLARKLAAETAAG